MRRKKRLARVVGAMMLGGFAGMALWKGLPREKLLLKRARQVAVISFVWSGKIPVNYPCYWISDDAALALEKPSVRFLVMSGASINGAERIDISTGEYRPLKALTRLLQKRTPYLNGTLSVFNGKRAQVAFPCQISPDGKWVSAYESLTGGCFPPPDFRTHSRSTIIALDGSQVIQEGWRYEEFKTLWMPDSQHWIEWRQEEEGPLALRVCGIHAEPHTYVLACAANCKLRPRGVTPNGTILASEEMRKDIGEEDGVDGESQTGPCTHKMIAFAPGSEHPDREFTLSLKATHQATCKQFVFSPQCDKVAWLVTYPYEPTGAALWRRLRAYFGDKPCLETAIWITNLEGTEAHEAGHLRHKPGDDLPQELAWLPSGAQLSFSYKGALYTIPAE